MLLRENAYCYIAVSKAHKGIFYSESPEYIGRQIKKLSDKVDIPEKEMSITELTHKIKEKNLPSFIILHKRRSSDFPRMLREARENTAELRTIARLIIRMARI